MELDVLYTMVTKHFVTMLLLSNYDAIKPGFHYTANATTTTQKHNDYRVEQSSFKLIALF